MREVRNFFRVLVLADLARSAAADVVILGAKHRDRLEGSQTLVTTIVGKQELAAPQRVVAAPPDVEAGVELRPALANDDRARGDDFAAVTLHAEALGVGVAAVAG